MGREVADLASVSAGVLERRYGLSFTVEELKAITTFGSLVALTQARLAEQEAASSGR